MERGAKTWQALWRAGMNGWRNRCPECGEGRIWNRDGGVNARCANCSLLFEPDKADWGGFMWAYTLEGAMIAVGIVIVELVTDLPFIQHVYLWLAFTVLFHLFFYRNMKGQWIGLRTALMGRPDSRV
jgi:uncharacterized protein (DUF983 family)